MSSSAATSRKSRGFDRIRGPFFAKELDHTARSGGLIGNSLPAIDHVTVNTSRAVYTTNCVCSMPWLLCLLGTASPRQGQAALLPTPWACFRQSAGRLPMIPYDRQRQRRTCALPGWRPLRHDEGGRCRSDTRADARFRTARHYHQQCPARPSRHAHEPGKRAVRRKHKRHDDATVMQRKIPVFLRCVASVRSH
jgi:hypothetical protein